MKSLTKLFKYTLFLAKWDEELGPIIIDSLPKSSSGNLESLAINIFATYQYFYDSPDKQYQKTKPTKQKTLEFGMKLISSVPSWASDRIFTFYLNKIRRNR